MKVDILEHADGSTCPNEGVYMDRAERPGELYCCRCGKVVVGTQSEKEEKS